MVATRLERRQKLAAHDDAVGRLVRPAASSVGRRPIPRIVTAVNLFDVSTLTNGETVAFPSDGSPAPQIEFRLPRDTALEDAHTLAVRFLRRRGPDYMPNHVRMVITLDERGRQRVAETF